MKKLMIQLGVLLVFLVSVCYAEDSPLAAAAKREKERRAKIAAEKTETKSFTNQDVEDFKAKNPTDESTSEEPGVEGEQPASDGTTGESAAAGEQKDDEAIWKEKAAAAQEKIKAAEEKVNKTQDDIDALWRYQTAVDDGQQQQKAVGERTERMNDLDSAKKELEEAKKAEEEMQEEARKEGVPPGWVEDREQ